MGLKLEGSREILGFWVFGAEGESSHNWETILKELWEREVRRVRLFISDDLPPGYLAALCGTCGEGCPFQGEGG